MAKILAFAGSPRQDGHSSLVMKELLGAARAKGADSRVFDLNDQSLRGCQGCFHCRDHDGCIIEDPLQPVYSGMKNAVGLVFASPIYFADISGQAKIWLDRMFPMLDVRTGKPRHPEKKIVTIFSQGDRNPARFEPSIHRLHGFLSTFGWKLQDSIVIAGVNSPGYVLPGEVLEKARAAGEALA